MGTLNLEDISKKMRKLTICMMSTKTSEGQISSRPMSNNADVAYDGNSYFFSLEDSDLVKELAAHNQVNLSFQSDHKFYASVMGNASASSKKEELEAHWADSLDKWFEAGINTPGITLIHVKANRIKYWDGDESGEFDV